jgi:hypothetical protein
VHAGRGPDGLAEREVDPDELDASQPHGLLGIVGEAGDVGEVGEVGEVGGDGFADGVPTPPP